MSAQRNDFKRRKENIPPEARGDAQWQGVDLSLAVDKWEMGWGTMYLGWADWGAERTHGICAPLPLFCFPACLRKDINRNCDQGYEGKLVPKKSSLSG